MTRTRSAHPRPAPSRVSLYGVDPGAPTVAELHALVGDFDGQVIEGGVDGTIRLAMGPYTLQLSTVCRFPIAGDPIRRCMLRTGHGYSCLPVPDGRGVAVR